MKPQKTTSLKWKHTALLVVFAILASCTPSAIATKRSSEDVGNGGGQTAAELRLPTDLSPLWYNITIKAYLPGFVEILSNKNLTFDASLTIKFVVNNATDKIVLNAVELNFSDNMRKYKLSQENKSAAPQVKQVIVDKTKEMVVFVLDGVLKPGEEYIFQILYSGPISDTLAGLYLSQYTDDTGKTRYAAVTQMEPTDARRLAPCFDEPQLKAVWKVRIIHPYGTSAISNGIELINAVKTDNPDWVMTTFKETLPMSSYLIAIAVSDFGFNEGFTSRGTRFRVWAREEALNQTSYALEAGINVLEFFEDYYGIPFPLEKQDMIALPDFSAGAMENWGLITYRERNLLYHSSLYAPMQKQRVAVVVAHELAHQWFGNLVTMNWWNDLWLNEGFATFMEYMGADAISDGNFRMDEYFLADAVNPALRRDAQVTSHPLYFPIEKAEDVNEVFDTITYQKGGSIIHMIEDVMGADNFRKGLNIYLNRFALSNADHNDLWDALNEVVPDTLLGWDGSKLDIRDFASRWTEQMGYPVMEIRRLNSTSVEIRQKRFKLNENAEEQKKFQNPKFGYKYDTPVRYEVNGKEEPMEWLHEDEAKVMEVTPDELLILNSGAHGFYRVNYDPESWQKINDHLLTDHTKIGLRSRARIIDDAFALAEAGHLSYEVALNISNYLRYEDEFLPWWMAAVGLSTILANFGDEPESEHVREYLGSLIAPLYERIDWSKLSTSYLDDKLFFQNELDYLIIGWYCTIRNVDCTERLVDLFKMNMLDACQGDEVLASECSRVPVPIRALVYCEGVKQAAEKVWNKLFELYRRERVQVERDRLLSALTCSRDTFTLKKFLNMASNLNDTTVRLQDVPTVFGGVGGSDVGSEIIFDYFQDNWPQLYRDFKGQHSLFSRIIASATNVKGDRHIAQLERFIEENENETSKLDVFEQQMEAAKANTVWLNRNFDVLTEWFRKQNALRKTG